MASNLTDPSTNKRRRLIGIESYGSRPKVLSEEEETMTFELYDFENLPQKRNEKIDLPTFKSHDDTSWKIRLYPRGHSKSSETTEYLSCYLHCLDVKKDSNKKVKAKYTFEIGSKFSETTKSLHTFSHDHKNSGYPQLAKRADVISQYLDGEGTLVLSVQLRICVEKKSKWYPKAKYHEHQSLGKELLESPTGTDVSFLVGQEQEIMNAHKSILSLRSPVLYEFVKDIPQCDHFEITDLKPASFRAILEHIYTGKHPDIKDENPSSEIGNVIEDTATELLLASDRFGLTELKLYMESEITYSRLGASSVADWLLIADGHSCPLLKEACMKLYFENPAEVMASNGWPKIVQSLDLNSELVMFSHNMRIPKDRTAIENMPVNRLREKLQAFGLDLDGTKTMLVQRLQDYNDSKNDDDEEEDNDN